MHSAEYILFADTSGNGGAEIPLLTVKFFKFTTYLTPKMCHKSVPNETSQRKIYPAGTVRYKFWNLPNSGFSPFVLRNEEVFIHRLDYTLVIFFMTASVARTCSISIFVPYNYSTIKYCLRMSRFQSLVEVATTVIKKELCNLSEPNY